MKIDVILDRIAGAEDIIPLFVGSERCKPLHEFGPYIRDYHIIHLCLSGEGVFFDKSGEHKISKGELFVIRQGEVTTYRASADNPWHYIWIAFRGKRAKDFDEAPSVLKYRLDLGERIYEYISSYVTSPDIYTAALHEILHSVTVGGDKTDKLSKIRRYIRYNYMMDITASSVAREFGFERSYLYRIFSKEYGIGIKEYIVKTRMEKARELLFDGMGVAECAHVVGYDDEFNFSRMYKKYYGLSPKHHVMKNSGK